MEGSVIKGFISDKATDQTPEGLVVYYQKYHTAIFKHAAYLTGNMQAAEDIAQETFIRLYNLPASHTNIGGWLMKVATNLSYNYLRGDRIRRSKEPIVAENEINNVISIEDAVIKDLELRSVRKALNSINTRDRLCLLLKFSGYKYYEIAEALDIDKNSIGKILSRSQAKFKEIYSKEAGLV